MSDTLSPELFPREVVALSQLSQQGMSLVMVQISPVTVAAETPVPDLALPRDCVLVAVVRGDRLLYPRGDTVLQPWDRVFAVVDRDAEDELREALTALK